MILTKWMMTPPTGRIKATSALGALVPYRRNSLACYFGNGTLKIGKMGMENGGMPLE
jgi:hypothetical protein